jgi:hypothetical protein
MGREVRCLVRSGGDEAEAKALLETDEVIVRSPFRLKVPRSDITRAAVDGDRLTIDHAGGPPLVLELGAKEAARWAHDIANPKTLADKLGVRPGQRVRLVGAADPELVGVGVAADGGEADVVFLQVDEESDLARIAELRAQIVPDGAIWVIRPKGRADLTEAMVLGAGRDAGMYDVKTARVSATHTGLKFVIPVADRA